MKRKDTKCYKDLVEKYCSSRFAFETAEDLISNVEKSIEKSQKKYAEIDNVDSTIKAWFDAFIFLCKSNIEKSMMNKEYYEGRMENYGKLLVMKYGEDLEKLYDDYEF